MLKVAIMLECFSVGGAQRVVSELVKNLDQSQCELRVICCENRADTSMARAIEEIAHVEYLSISGKNIISNFRKAFSALDQFKPDIIHAHLTSQLYAVPWGILHKIPVLITAHTKPNQAFVKKIEPLIRWGIKRSRVHIVTVSHENHQMMKEYFSIDNSCCSCINNGIAINDFYRTDHPNFTFINVARQDENKNQAAIVRCFARLYAQSPNTRLLLVGDGPCHTKLIEQCSELGIMGAVELPGAVANVADYYAKADVYVQSSHREAMPMSALEAMAAGLCIISTDVGGMRDIVNGNGILVEDHDEASLQKAMKALFDCLPDEIEQYRMVSRQIVERYSSKSMAHKYMDLFVKLAS